MEDNPRIKKRLDVLLSDIANYSREFSKELILKGHVKIDGNVVTKPGEKINADSVIEFQRPDTKYVSRGGYKLEKALDFFHLDITEKVCMDVGASTGGFTDCMLQNGAARIYAIDTGTDQLAPCLKENPSVISLEKINIKTVPDEITQKLISEKIQFATVDVSFISLTKVLLSVFDLIDEDAQVLCLIKPQFEAGRGHMNKKGVVTNKTMHIHILKTIEAFAKNNSLRIRGLVYSPIRGPEGNIEYLALTERNKIEVSGLWTADSCCFNENEEQSLENLVEEAFAGL